MTPVLFFQTLIGGILQGGIFALTSIGLSLALGVLGIVNFAHGEFLMLALYLAWLLPDVLSIGPYATALVSVPFLFLLGVFVGSVFILGLLVNTMAPSFGTTRSEDAAFKLVAYVSTPVWVAGFLTVVPELTTLAMLAGFRYAVYLFEDSEGKT